MDVPVTVARELFRQQIIEQINQSELPAFIKRGVMEELHAALKEQEGLQLQRDMEAYLKQQEEAEKE